MVERRFTDAVAGARSLAVLDRRYAPLQFRDRPGFRLGYYADNFDGSGVRDLGPLLAVEAAVGYQFASTNAYENMWFYSNTSWAKFVKPVLDGGLAVNFFSEFRGSGDGQAQLAGVLAGAYDAKVNLFCDHVLAYAQSMAAVGRPMPEVRILPFHEWNLDSGPYEWLLSYNRSTGADVTSAAVNGALGVNNPADFVPAFERIAGLIRGHAAAPYIKICLTVNYSGKSRYDLAQWLPSRSSYDYLGIDVYNVQAYWVGAKFIAETNGLQAYKQLAAASDAPIILSEVGSNASSGANSRPDWLYESLMDVYHTMPRVVEFVYFSAGGKELASIDYPAIGRFVDDSLMHRETGITWSHKDNLRVKPSVITKELGASANWTVGGSNAGTLAIASTGNSPEGAKGSKVLSLTHTTSGADPLLNYAYWVEAVAAFDANVPHVLTFQARGSVDGMALAAGVVNAGAATVDNIRGATWLAPKLSTGWREYRVGIASGFPSWTGMRCFFGLGHNSAAGTLYVDLDSVKIERGEVPSAVTSGSNQRGSQTAFANITLSSTSPVVNRIAPTTANIIATLPPVATSTDQYLVIRNRGTAGFSVLVTPSSGEQIDALGANTQVTLTDGEALTLHCDGAVWRRLGNFRPVPRMLYTSIKTASATLTDVDEYVRADATSGAVTLTLPTAAGKVGQTHTVIRLNSGANGVGLATTSSQTINGSSTYALAAQYSTVTVVSNGSNWEIANKIA